MSGKSTNYFAHQDIETLDLRGKNIHAKKKAQREGNTETRDKYDSSHSNAMRKLDNETENFKVQKLNPKILIATISLIINVICGILSPFIWNQILFPD